MTLLALGLTLAAIAVWATRGRRALRSTAPPAMVLATYLAPALFVAVTLFLAQGDLRLRFALLGLGFQSADGSGVEVEIGGDREAHDVWISAYDDGGSATSDDAESDRRQRLSQAVLSVQPASSEEDRASIEVIPSAGPSPGLLGTRRDGKLQPIRSIELLDGDLVQVAQGHTWRVRFGGLFDAPASFERVAAEPLDDEPAAGEPTEGGSRADATSSDELIVEIPRRVNELPIVRLEMPVFRPAAPTIVTYPLAWLERSAGAEWPASTGSFFYWVPSGAASGRLYLAGDEAVVVRSGEPVERPAEWSLTSGDRLHALGLPRWDGREFPGGGIRDLRSALLLTGRSSLATVYDTPEVFALGWTDLVELGELVSATDGPNDDAAPSASQTLRVHLSMGGWQLVDRSLYFRHASLSVALEALAILEFPVDVDANGLQLAGGTFTAATPRGQIAGRFGDPLWLGEEHLAAVQVDRVEPPLGLAVLVLLIALAKFVAARAVRCTKLHVLGAATLEALLALRLLLGFQAWALPPFAEEPYALAVAAWMALPWTYLAVSFPIVEGRRRSDLLRALVVACGLLLSLAVCIRLAGGGFATGMWIALHVGAAAVPVVRSLELPRRPLEWLDDRLAIGPSSLRAVLAWSALGFVPTVVRGTLFLLGYRESLQLGRRIALSLIHVPLAIALQALFLLWLWRHIGRSRKGDLWLIAPTLAFVLGTWIVPALGVSDLGLALLNLPVLLLALTVLLVAAQPHVGRQGRGRVLMAAGGLGLLLVLLLLPIGARLLIAVIPESVSETLYSERNYLRVLDFAAPERLEGVARRTSEELAVMAAVLRTYTTVGLSGRGYLETEVSPHLRATALREHVPAVFIGSQWGWAGATGLVLLLLVSTGAGLALLPHRLPARQTDELTIAGLAGTAGGLAALTVGLPSLYMLLANYRLALFTGKNIYLLGLDSTADVLEACVLFLLFGLGAAAVRDD